MALILQRAIRKFRRRPTEGARVNRNTLLQLQLGTANLESSSFLMQYTAILLSVWSDNRKLLVSHSCLRSQQTID
ncbi:hypothetical protein ABMA28_000191 [Loxostege sticticalis]|uniref:Uncharacterized protein n=1 Tax=Loxostege sticticalis TaxID=481309 RepID=A0ABD0TRW7_LOXSC